MVNSDQSVVIFMILVIYSLMSVYIPGRVAQSVTCLATDASLTADPRVASSNLPGPILSWRLIMK